MIVDTDIIAQKYAEHLHWDEAKPCAAQNGYVYYLLSADRFKGKKIGLPALLKVSSSTGRVLQVSKINEIMWAISQQVPQSP